MNVRRSAFALVLLGAVACTGASCSVSCDAAFAYGAGDVGDAETEHMLLIIPSGAFAAGDAFDEGMRLTKPVSRGFGDCL